MTTDNHSKPSMQPHLPQPSSPPRDAATAAAASYIDHIIRRLDERIAEKTASGHGGGAAAAVVRPPHDLSPSQGRRAEQGDLLDDAPHHIRRDHSHTTHDDKDDKKDDTEVNHQILVIHPYNQNHNHNIDKEKEKTKDAMFSFDSSLSKLDSTPIKLSSKKDHHEQQLGNALDILDGSHPRLVDETTTSTFPGAYSNVGTLTPTNSNNHDKARNDTERDGHRGTGDEEEGVNVGAVAVAGRGRGRGHDDVNGDEEDGGRLAVAVAVNDDDEDNIEEAVPAAIEYDPDTKPIFRMSKRRRILVWGTVACACGMILVAAIVGGLGVFRNNKRGTTTLGGDGGGDDGEDSLMSGVVSSPPTSYRESLGIREKIEQLLVGSEKLNDPTTPHSRALQWILYEDPRLLDGMESSALLQRYLHVLLYLATTQHTPWAFCNPPNHTLVEEDEDDTCMQLIPTRTYPVMEFQGIKATRWLTGHHECDWVGVACDNNHRAQALELPFQNITGTLPMELSLFPFLRIINLSWNQFTGSLPLEYGNLDYLENLELHFNELTGSIPDTYWNRLDILQQINLGSNFMTGTLSSSISNVNRLGGLFLFDNFFTGFIPTEIGNLTNLVHLRMQRTSFSGTIPSELGTMNNLEELWMHKTNLHGTLPSHAFSGGGGNGRLSSTLVDIRLHTIPNLTGPIPMELFTNFTHLKRIDLYDTQLSGSIPSSIGNTLTNLMILRVKNMPNLIGTIPTELGQLQQLQRVWMEGTNLTGSMPTELCELRNPAHDDEDDNNNNGGGSGGGGPLLFYDLTADCAATTTSGIPTAPAMECLCCTLCCDRHTGECGNTTPM